MANGALLAPARKLTSRRKCFEPLLFLEYDRRGDRAMTAYESLIWPPGKAPESALCGDEGRAAVLASYRFDLLEADTELESIVRFAATLCDTPVALVTLVERDRQRFFARHGIDLQETPRSASFCAHTMLRGEVLEVPHATQEPHFADNPLVTGAEHVRFYAGAPLITPEGAPLGALCVIDRVPRPGGLSDRQRQGLSVLAQAIMRRLQSRRLRLESKEEAFERTRQMREIADMVPAIVWSADAEGRFDYFNSKWPAMTGRDPPASVADWRPAVHPEDADRTLERWRESFANSTPFECHYRLKQTDGSWRWMLARALPVPAADGSVVRWFGTLTDVDEGERRSRNRDLLARELSHRIKNIFAVVSSLIALRRRKHPGSETFADELLGAIRALGRAHDFVRPLEGAKGESLRGLLTELMAPYQDGEGTRVRIEGDDCTIGARSATPLALVFHELATNSAKYGALSVDSGTVELLIECPEHGDTTRIHWREMGGPEAGEPQEDGFGSRLITMSVEGQLGGRLDRRFLSGGLEVDLEVKNKIIRS